MVRCFLAHRNPYIRLLIQKRTIGKNNGKNRKKPEANRQICNKSYSWKSQDGTPIGYVTSGTQSPSLAKAIGMGYVAKAYAALDTGIYVKVRDKLLQAKVVKIPFA